MKTLGIVVNYHQSPLLGQRYPDVLPSQQIRSTLEDACPGVPCLEIGPFDTAMAFLEGLLSISKDYDELIVAAADAPLLRADLVLGLLDLHRRYRAEYTFGDGFPTGLTPELLSPTILPTLIAWCRTKPAAFSREVIFEVMSTDINRFDVETHLAPVDLRMKRLSLTCDTTRNALLLRKVLPFAALPIKEFLEKLDTFPGLVRTLPATLLVQITNGQLQLPRSSPQALFQPGVLTDRQFLDRGLWNQLLDRMLAFAGDLTVMPAFWGEPSLHPEVAGLFQDALAKPGLRLCVETSGLGWNDADLTTLAEAASGRLDWIVELDSNDPATYHQLRGEGFALAHATVRRLLELFPGHVWPQTTRVTDNEPEMEEFYKTWKKTAGQVIIQKHNFFGGRLASEKPADLSPWNRHACWHAARDLAVFLDGTTVPCRDDYQRSLVAGNAFTDEPATLWARGTELFERHEKGEYPEVCRHCDEYYTFHF